MDRKRYEVKKIAGFITVILFVCFFIYKCMLPLDNKIEITKSITIENGKLLKIVLDDTNEKKCIGDINFYGYIYINQAGVFIGPVKEENGEKIIICDIRGYEYLFYDNQDCSFRIKWPGGNITIDTKYSGGKFELLNESLLNGI